jgi:hypothetical protein
VELWVRDVIVVFEGRPVVLASASGGSRVICTVVQSESHAGLLVVQEFLGETVGDCSIFKCRERGDILIDIATWKYGVPLHVLKHVQEVGDVTTKIVEVQFVVLLLESGCNNQIVEVQFVVLLLESCPVLVMKYADCKRFQNQNMREKAYKQTNSQRKSNMAVWHGSIPWSNIVA